MSYSGEVVALEAAGGVEAFLSENPSLHTVPLAILDRARRTPVPDLLVARAVDADGRTAACGVRGGYVAMALSAARERAASVALAHAVAAAAPDLGGASGPQPAVSDFASAWAELRRCGLREGMQERLYSLGALRLPGAPPGSARPATGVETELLAGWIRAFDAEALGGTPVSDRTEWVREALRRGELWVWDDAGPVCVVGARTMPPAQARIGPVYSPPEHRGRGYGSACVAAVSAEMQRQGRQCVLYTDVTNRTANKIYAAIGYEPIAEAAVFWFTPPS